MIGLQYPDQWLIRFNMNWLFEISLLRNSSLRSGILSLAEI